MGSAFLTALKGELPGQRMISLVLRSGRRQRRSSMPSTRESMPTTELGETRTDSNARDEMTEAVQPASHARAQDRSVPQRRRVTVITIVLLGYAALSQYSASSTGVHAKTIGAALSVVPVLAIAVVLLWLWSWRLAATLVAAVSSLLLYRNWPVIERNYEWADLVQQCGVYALVTLAFARSLFAGRIPLCTQLAHQMYGELAAIESTYLLRATAAWALFYAFMTGAVLGLFFAVSLAEWSLFVNFIAWGLMVLAGLLDHALRRRLLPRHREGGILALIRRSIAG
jgi:uncharacterized membrane protein